MREAAVSRKRLFVLLAACLMLAGCGKDAADTVITTGDGGLGASLARTAEVTTYRMSSWTAQTIELPFLGVSSIAEIEDQEPTIVAEISPDRQHHVIDLSGFLGVLGGGAFDIKLEVWSDEERVVIDSRDYQVLMDLASDIQPGPLAPGVFFVDLRELGADSSEVLNALADPPALALGELAENLHSALAEAEQISSDPPTYAGTTTFSELPEAQGQDIAATARGAAAGLASMLPVDIDMLSEFYVEYYNSAEVEVVIELDEGGLLHVLSTRADMSNLYDELLEFEPWSAELQESERREALEWVDDAVQILETRTVFEADPDLDVPLPPDTTDDRTDLWKDFLSGAGSS